MFHMSSSFSDLFAFKQESRKCIILRWLRIWVDKSVNCGGSLDRYSPNRLEWLHEIWWLKPRKPRYPKEACIWPSTQRTTPCSPGSESSLCEFPMEVAGSSWEKWTFELIKFKFLKSLDRGRRVWVCGGGGADIEWAWDRQKDTEARTFSHRNV